jgi:hypothetical protein
VLFAVGVVGTYFTLLSDDVLLYQEKTLQKSLLVAARKMDAFIVQTQDKVIRYSERKMKDQFK